MTIIVSEKGRHARRLERRTIRHEDYLQRYIYEIRKPSRWTSTSPGRGC